MTFVIAEAGVNHNGDLRTAEKLIVAAKRAGAHAVKFQLFSAQRLGRPALKPLEISYPDMEGLKQYADRQGIEFMCTPFDVDAVRFLVPLVKRMKVSSGLLTDDAFLDCVAQTGLPTILSTGMSAPDEIAHARARLREPTLLHCTSAYPCPLEAVNLRAMLRLPPPFGFSDHTAGTVAAIAAAALGATVIEKHLTLNRYMDGLDHRASIEPQEFRWMTNAIRQARTALGDGIKKREPAEDAAWRIWRDKR